MGLLKILLIALFKIFLIIVLFLVFFSVFFVLYQVGGRIIQIDSYFVLMYIMKAVYFLIAVILSGIFTLLVFNKIDNRYWTPKPRLCEPL